MQGLHIDGTTQNFGSPQNYGPKYAPNFWGIFLAYNNLYFFMHIKVVHILKTHNCAYFKVHICGNFVHVQFCILWRMDVCIYMVHIFILLFLEYTTRLAYIAYELCISDLILHILLACLLLHICA